MIVEKNINIKGVFSFTGMHIIWLTIWVSFVAFLYYFTGWEWMNIPWLPVSIIGTAVAFYVGFKNNQSYDRLWEARKIWGSIVNDSRAWGSEVKNFVTNQFNEENLTEDELFSIKRRLIYRHIAWLYTLRNQLLQSTPWEHINQNKHVANITRKRMKSIGVGLFEDGVTEKALEDLLPKNEYERLINYENTATHIIDQQASDLKKLRSLDLIDDFRHMAMQGLLNQFYAEQGKCERIKKFPLPRQYGAFSFVFVGIFIFLLPFGMVPAFAKLGEYGAFIAIPFTILVAWVYLVMELIGDYSENPFEGLINDIPMLSLVRTIEIDLKQMLNEKDIPSAIEAKNGVLM